MDSGPRVDALLARVRALPCDTDPRLVVRARAESRPLRRKDSCGRAPMHILSTILIVLGAWLLLAVPVALVMGRFLRAGDRLAAAGDRATGSWFDSAA